MTESKVKLDKDIIASEQEPLVTQSDSPSKDEYRTLQLDSEQKKKLTGLITNGITWLGNFIIISIIIILFVRGLHLLLPSKYGWLDSSQLSAIDHIIVGVTSGFVARFFPSKNHI